MRITSDEDIYADFGQIVTKEKVVVITTNRSSILLLLTCFLDVVLQTIENPFKSPLAKFYLINLVDDRFLYS